MDSKKTNLMSIAIVLMVAVAAGLIILIENGKDSMASISPAVIVNSSTNKAKSTLTPVKKQVIVKKQVPVKK